MDHRTDGSRQVRDDRAELVAALSHDLAAPIRVIAGFAELLGEHRATLSPEQVDRYLGHVAHGAERLQQMLEALVQHCRLDLEHDPDRAEPVDLGRIVHEAVTDRSGPPGAAVVTVGDLPSVAGDAAQLRRLVGELLDNSLAAGRSGGPVTTRSARTHEATRW